MSLVLELPLLTFQKRRQPVLCGGGAVMMSRTSHLFLISASAMSERWHRHGTASAHIIAVFLTLAILEPILEFLAGHVVGKSPEGGVATAKVFLLSYGVALRVAYTVYAPRVGIFQIIFGCGATWVLTAHRQFLQYRALATAPQTHRSDAWSG
jgi:hypothetical protein